MARPINCKLQRAIDADMEERREQHQAAIARFAMSQEYAESLGEKADFKGPLVLLANGDSWFDYPMLDNDYSGLIRSDIIWKLKRLGPVPPLIVNVAHHGDATTQAMALPKQQRMIKELADRRNWLKKGKPDAILFSAGGNDVAGEQFCMFLDYAKKGASGLNKERFDGVLSMVRSGYLSMFAFRDRYAPGVQIYGHCYDVPIPNGGRTNCPGVGPWLKPSLDFCNWSTEEGKAIVREALEAFRELLRDLAKQEDNRFTLIETQGTLKPSDWANELHPTQTGFDKITAKFAAALKL